jgi:hypothetical protein
MKCACREHHNPGVDLDLYVAMPGMDVVNLAAVGLQCLHVAIIKKAACWMVQGYF